MKRPLYPLFLDLQDRPVLVVGAGTVGTHKIQALLTAGAAVTVVAPKVTDPIALAAERGELRWHKRPFVTADLDGVYFVIAATNDHRVNAEVAQAAAAARLFVNAVDDPSSASAYASACIVRGGVTVAISSGGRAPAVSRLLRELLEQVLPSDETLADWIERAASLRTQWQNEHTPLPERYRDLLRRLLLREPSAQTAIPSGDTQESAA